MSYPGSQPYDDSFDPKESCSNPFMLVSQQPQQQPLYSIYAHDPPQGWPQYDQTLLPQFQSQPLPYRGLPGPVPHSAPRLSSSPNVVGGGHTATSLSRFSLAGSLDPTTGIFYRTPEHPRLRTAQACEKCRTRKAKCSGEHPSCKRCINRGLVCEYAKEGRVRGPNKAKNAAGASNSSLKNVSTSAGTDFRQNGKSQCLNGSTSPVDNTGTSLYTSDGDKTQESNPSPEGHSPASPSTTNPDSLCMHPSSRTNVVPLSQSSPHASSLPQDLYSLPGSSVSSRQSSRRNSLVALGMGLGEHRASRPRPPNLGLVSTNPWRQEAMEVGNAQAGWINPPNVRLDLDHLGTDFGVDLQDPQRQYEGQRLELRRQISLQEQRRTALQQRHILQQQPSAAGGMDYHQVHQVEVPQHLPSFVMISTESSRRQNGMDPEMGACQLRCQTYSPRGEFVRQREANFAYGMHPLRSQGYQGQRIPSTLGPEENHQRASTEVGATEQDLHPSLSRIDRRVDFLHQGIREEWRESEVEEGEPTGARWV